MPSSSLFFLSLSHPSKRRKISQDRIYREYIIFLLSKKNQRPSALFGGWYYVDVAAKTEKGIPKKMRSWETFRLFEWKDKREIPVLKTKCFLREILWIWLKPKSSKYLAPIQVPPMSLKFGGTKSLFHKEIVSSSRNLCLLQNWLFFFFGELFCCGQNRAILRGPSGVSDIGRSP